MTARCPSCLAKVPSLGIRSSFACPLCQVRLRSNFRVVFPVVLLLGGGAEIALLLFFQAQLGGLAIAVYAWLIVSGLSALAIYSLFVQLFIHLSVEA